MALILKWNGDFIGGHDVFIADGYARADLCNGTYYLVVLRDGIPIATVDLFIVNTVHKAISVVEAISDYLTVRYGKDTTTELITLDDNDKVVSIQYTITRTTDNQYN